MKAGELAHNFAHGTIATLEKMIPAADLNWVEHPTFGGVYLKHLVVGADTHGQLSCHLVRIEPGCTLETHVHAAQWELHEVIAGQGTGILGENTLAYGVGQMTIIPCGTPHAVTAGPDGLVLFAKFFPALL